MSRFLTEIPVELIASAKGVRKEEYSMPIQNPYAQAKQNFRTQAFAPTKPAQNFGVKTGGGLDYEVGDRVRHMKFGEGLVTGIVEGGRDYEVTVQFDTAGVKKMFAGFAKLQKI
jgi:DNA helicase-2/ATP-dependent DNA helicase PcrA